MSNIEMCLEFVHKNNSFSDIKKTYLSKSEFQNTYNTNKNLINFCK